MNIRIMSKFFSLLFLFSCTFIAEAARIIFLNRTGESLTIEYNGENFVIGVDGEQVVESTIWRQYMPLIKNNIDGNVFRFKIGKGEFREKHFDNFKDPKGTDTGSAISGNNTRCFKISGYDEDIQDCSEEDRYGILRNGLEIIYSYATNRVKKEFENYLTLKPDEKVDISMGYTLSGATKNPHLEGENISIRKLGNKKSIASAGEIVSVNHRMRVIQEKQENFLEDKFKDYEIPLSIGFAGSGGGVRARLSTTGFVKGAIDTGLLDCITYFSALSGSSWMLAPWIMRKDGTSIENFIENIILCSGEEKMNYIPLTGIPTSEQCLNLIKMDYSKQMAWYRPKGIVNAFGQILKETFLNGLVSEEDYENLYLSNIRENVENGSTFIPIFEIRAEKHKGGEKPILEPCFFTPWEFGSRYFGKNGACINIKTFGSKFYFGNKFYTDNTAKLFNISDKIENSFERGTFLIGPEPGLELIMATCGSAFTCSPSFAITGVAKQNIDENIHKTRHSNFDENLINCEFNNFMENDKDFVGFYGKEILCLHDAGLIANIPVDSLYRRPEDIAHGITEGSAPDIIFIFDSSDTHAGTLGEELMRNKIEMEKKGLPFPQVTSKDNDKMIAPEIIEAVKKSAFYIFDENPDKGKPENEKKFHDWQIPTIIYMTLVGGQKASIGNESNSDNFTFNFNNFPTFNFKYDRKSCNGLITLTGNIIRKNLEAIKIAMKKRRILNLERYLWSIDNAERNKDKLLNYCNEIDNKNNNIKQKICTLQIKVKDLNKEKKAISGLLENEQREEEINDEIKRIEKEISKNIVIENQNEKLMDDIDKTIKTEDSDCIRIKEEIGIEKEKINKEEKDYNEKLKTNNDLDSGKITEGEKNQKKEMLNNVIFYIDLEDNFFEILRKEGPEKVFLKKSFSEKTKIKIMEAANLDKCNLDITKGIGIIFEHKNYTSINGIFKSGLYGQLRQLKNADKIKKIFIKYLKNLDIDTPVLKQKVKKTLIEKDFLPNKAAPEPKKSIDKSAETPLEPKYPVSKSSKKEKSKNSAAAIKVEALVDFARKNDIFIGENSFKVGDTTNHVYQLEVDGQPEGNTCGPRACFNCLKFIEYFDKSYNKGAKEISENFRSNKNALNFLRDAAKTLNIYGFPINLNMHELEQIKGSNIKIFEGYEDFNVPGLEVVNLESQKEGFFTGFVFKKGIVENGYTQSEAANIFVDPKGLMKSNGNPIGDHWICLFVVKTGKKEYSWFIADSLNDNRVKEPRITAYIHRLFGQDYKPYDNFMTAEKEKVDKRTELELITIITRMVDNTSDKEIKETITRQYGVINGKKISDNDVFNRFLTEKIINISAMKYTDQETRNDLIGKIVKAGRSRNERIFLERLNQDIDKLNKFASQDNTEIKEKEIIDRLTIRGYPGAENIKTVIIENVKNAFDSKIKKLNKKPEQNIEPEELNDGIDHTMEDNDVD